MTGFVVGDQARPFSIRHAPGSDVRFALLLTDPAGASTSLPAGSVVELIVDGLASPLPGTVTAGRVDWDIQSAAFAGLPSVTAAAVWYRQGTFDGRWFAGYYQSTTGTVSTVTVPGTVQVSTEGVQLLTVALAVGIPGPGAGGGAVTSVDGAVGVVVLSTDAAAGVGSKRTLGTGPLQATAGDDPRLSDQRTPPDNAVTNAQLADVATATLKGRTTAATGDPEDLTPAQARTLLNVADGSTANSADATLLARANHTGTQSSDTLTDGTTSKTFLAAERTKLTGIAAGATANDTDANLKARAGHTGTQTAATVSDFAGAADARVAAAVGVSVQAFDTDLTAFAAKTAPAGAVVGTTDVQTLTNKTLTSPAVNTPTGIVKADVGLSNVDNTSDAGKPVSTAQAAADATRQPLDSDLTVIAALTPTTNNFIASAASAWASRTPAQVRTTLNVADGATANAVPGILLRAAGDVYLTVQPSLTGRVVNVINQEMAYPITIGQGGIQVTGLQIKCEVAVASSTIRLGIRADNAGKPGTLILDAGTVSTATTGIKTVTVAWTPTSGTRYWLSATVQGSATAPAVLSIGLTNSTFSLAWPANSTDPAAGTQTVVQYVDSTTGSGALPSAFTIATVSAGSEWGMAHIWLRT